MARETPVTRRSALETIAGAVAVGVVPATASAAGTDDESARKPRAAELTASKRGGFETHDGTVDRVVDGDHVVILIEENGAVTDQHVVPADDYPNLEEGDAVGVLRHHGTLVYVWER